MTFRATALAVLLSVSGRAGATGSGGAAAPTSGSAPQQPIAAMVARIDELHRRRDERPAWNEEQRLVQAALARAPDDYGVLWRAARFYFWASDDPGVSRDQRSRWGKDGWDIAEHAIAVNPNDVAGYYWAAVCMGNYALGLGVVKALAHGLEGKFKDRLAHAETLSPGYEHGAIDTAWGRFYDKLPWPKRDRKKAEERFLRAVAAFPDALRARVYLASTYLDEGRAPDAKRLLDEVATAAPGHYDAAEERRAKALAQGLVPAVYAKLK